MQLPPTQTCPSLGVSSPAIRFSSVVLPLPLGPMSARKSPWATFKFNPLSTSTRSLPRVKNLCTPCTATMGGPDFMRSNLLDETNGERSILHTRRRGWTNRLASFTARVTLQKRHRHSHFRLEIDSFFLGR